MDYNSAPAGAVAPLRLYHKHRIPIRAETILLFHCCLICIKQKIVTGECRNHHQQRRIWKMEITDHHIGYLKFIRRENEFVGPAIKWLKITGRRDGTFKGPDYRGTYCT